MNDYGTTITVPAGRPRERYGLADRSVVTGQRILHDHPALHARTPMGGTIVDGGATFRVWAPRATDVYLLCDANQWTISNESKLRRWDDETFAGFAPDMRHGDRYKLYVFGPGSDLTGGPKRDPYARELSESPGYPHNVCVLYDPRYFPWHDQTFRPVPFNDLVLYQLHIGTFFRQPGRNNGTFLDVIDKLDYLESMGINAIQPLPITEFAAMFGMSYHGTDLYAPENAYAVYTRTHLEEHLERINAKLIRKGLGRRPYSMDDLAGAANQFRAMIDLCHIHGIAVILDVVYSHAGGNFGDESIYFFDRAEPGSNNNSLFFTDRPYAGGLMYAHWNQHVRQFLIENATYYLQECHVDGLRLDEVTAIKNESGEAGLRFCRDLTDTLRFAKPQAIQIAESWPVEEAIVRPTQQGGAGFDAIQNDGLRNAIRTVISQAAGGAHITVDMDRLGYELRNPMLPDSWRAVNSIENADTVYRGRDQRIPKLADPANPRSWYAASRTRVATGLLLTAPGIPTLFMGQEILEDKQWQDDPNSSLQIYWQGLLDSRAPGHKPMADFQRYISELINLRRRLPALRSNAINVYFQHNMDRVIAFHRWIPGSGQDVVVIASLREETLYNYRIGFPHAGYWKEILNSDVYENYVNPRAAGNGGGVQAIGEGYHNLTASASITIPANSILIFTRS